MHAASAWVLSELPVLLCGAVSLWLLFAGTARGFQRIGSILVLVGVVICRVGLPMMPTREDRRDIKTSEFLLAVIGTLQWGVWPPAPWLAPWGHFLRALNRLGT